MQLRDDRLLLSPSVLNDFVECEHRTSLAREVALGMRARPGRRDPGAEMLAEKGAQHESSLRERFREEGRAIVDIAMENWDYQAAAEQTIQAMRRGADVITQATFVDGAWRGRADFLTRVDGSSRLGGWRYEAIDAKLARTEKPTVLQLCFYSDGIAKIQGVRPEHMHVYLGVGQSRLLRVDDFSAYYRRVRSRFERAVAQAPVTEPYPVENCSVCEFAGVCNERWRAEDSLVFVAGVRRAQVVALREAQMPTLAALAHAPAAPVPDPIAAHAFAALRDQAHLQLERRTSGRLDWHRIDADEGRGFAMLPRPSAGDVIFDIEGDPFWEPARGLHFLFGVLLREGGEWVYRPMWAHDRDGERRMFEAFVDLVHERLAADPGMHVFHYGVYENAALKQLMGTYATRESEVDALLRRRVLVNLHNVVRQGLRAGVESYSLKEVEKLVPYARQAQVQRGIEAVLAYEQWMRERADALLDGIADYNEDDCRATLALRDWLVDEHADDEHWLEPPAGEVKEENVEQGERAELRRQLTEGEEAGSPRWLAGQLMEYHRREARPGWWWFFERCDHMSDKDLLEDAECIAGLLPIGPPVADKRSQLYPMTFPVQQHKLAAGDKPTDRATKKSAGTIEALDEEAGTLQLRRGPSFAGVPLPMVLIPGGPIRNTAQREALTRLARSLRAGDGRYPALADILARNTPRIAGQSAGAVIQTIDIGEQRSLVRDLDSSYLFIQGPPGTGKTWTGARLITDLIRQGRRVGVAATSHKAIHNLLEDVERAAKAEGLTFSGMKKASAKDPDTCFEGDFVTSADDAELFAIAGDDCLLFAGTAWLFADERLDHSVDTLFIDEAGQVSLADALAMATAARNVVLLGDPLQLAQVSQGTHPEGAGASVLEHLLGDDATVRPDMGLFLEQTRRMHPDVCRFISEIVYDNRLQGVPERRVSPLRWERGCVSFQWPMWATRLHPPKKRRRWSRKLEAWSASRGQIAPGT